MKTPEQLRALAETLNSIYAETYAQREAVNNTVTYLFACADAKPVAYRQWDVDEGYWYYGDASCAEKDDELLYTHPAPVAPQEK